MPHQVQTMFVTGTAKSGTSVVTQFLQADPHVVLGRERFTGLLGGPPEEFGPHLFEKHRFCVDFRLSDSHHATLADYYREALARFDDATVVGDKIPQLAQHLDVVVDRFPGARVIYTARDPVEVADSFERQARKTREAVRTSDDVDLDRMWPPDRGWRAAIDEWNASVAGALGRSPDLDLLVVDYARLFVDDDLYDEILDFLALEPTPETRRMWRRRVRSRANIEAARERVLTPDEVRAVTDGADHAAFQRLLAT